VLFDVLGRHPADERAWLSWPGYANSRPVRVGNGASGQHQLDGYGWVLDAAWLLTEAEHGLYSEAWRTMRGLADEVLRRWSEPDAGIWEVRDAPAHHVHSKVMAWLALDRAGKIAVTRQAPRRQIQRWSAGREAIKAEVLSRGFDPKLGSYTRTYGSSDLDGALLMLPSVGIEPPDSPRVRGTIDAIRRQLSAGGPLLFRYPPGHDGLAGTEGAFLPCSFWLVQALAATGRPDEAHDLFSKLIGYGRPLGLFAEEINPSSGASLGNFPQALTHASLVQAALALRAANRDRPAVRK
jgi:GH15 family glucan-1,4-alpha-glucosidase